MFVITTGTRIGMAKRREFHGSFLRMSSASSLASLSPVERLGRWFSIVKSSKLISTILSGFMGITPVGEWLSTVRGISWLLYRTKIWVSL